jgi:hypothetical protein
MLTVFVPSAGYDPRHRLVQALHMRRRDANLTADELECLTAAAALVRASA